MKTLNKKQCIADANDVFSYIDSDFRNWKTNKLVESKNGDILVVHELTEDETFAQMFTDPEKMWLSQSQIIEFCQNRKSELSEWYTFFLFKVSNEFFVAYVLAYPDGYLNAHCRRFSDGIVWYAEHRYRIVIPQLTLKTSEPKTPSDFDSLTISNLEKRIEKLESLFNPKLL